MITEDSVSNYLDNLYRPLNAALGEIRSSAEQSCIPIIHRNAETFLLQLMRMLRPQNILEIGTAVGYSAACFAENDPCCRVVTIESDPQMAERARENFETLGLNGRIHLFLGDGEEVVSGLPKNERFDFVFIDAAKSHYQRFWNAVVPHCSAESIIISDNVLLRGAITKDADNIPRKHRTYIRNMQEYLEEISSSELADTSVIPVGDGIAISRLKEKR